MQNYWMGRYAKRQIDTVEDFLNRTFTNLAIMRRPVPNGLKLFVKQMGLHIGNIVRVRNTWEIQYYESDGGYGQKPLPAYNTGAFWRMIKDNLEVAISRGTISK